MFTSFLQKPIKQYSTCTSQNEDTYQRSKILHAFGKYLITPTCLISADPVSVYSLLTFQQKPVTVFVQSYRQEQEAETDLSTVNLPYHTVSVTRQ